MELATAAALIDALQKIPRKGPLHQTFMELSGYPHYENVCSNILRFFLDPSPPHSLGSLCLEAILQAAKTTGTPALLSNVEVEREVGTDRGNRLDILITSDSHVIGIENKIFATDDSDPQAFFTRSFRAGRTGLAGSVGDLRPGCKSVG
jgi:hypothetical protein